MTDLDRIKKLSGIEQVKEGAWYKRVATMPFMKAIKRYVEDQDGRIVGDYDVDEPRLYVDVGNLMTDVMNMLEEEYPDVEIIPTNQKYRYKE